MAPIVLVTGTRKLAPRQTSTDEGPICFLGLTSGVITMRRDGSGSMSRLMISWSCSTIIGLQESDDFDGFECELVLVSDELVDMRKRLLSAAIGECVSHNGRDRVN